MILLNICSVSNISVYWNYRHNYLQHALFGALLTGMATGKYNRDGKLNSGLLPGLKRVTAE